MVTTKKALWPTVKGFGMTIALLEWFKITVKKTDKIIIQIMVWGNKLWLALINASDLENFSVTKYYGTWK